MRWVPTANWPDGRRWELLIGDRVVGHVCREQHSARTYVKVTGQRPRVDSTEPSMREAVLWLLERL